MSGPEDGGSLREKTQSFLREFFSTGEALVRELVEENERLKAMLAEQGKPVDVDEPDIVPRQVAEALMAKIDRLERECEEIRSLAGKVRRVSGTYRQRLDQLEQEHFHLAAMHVAGNQFHAATTLEDVFRTITEVLLNFVGIGAFTLYGYDVPARTLFPVFREGNEGLPPPEDIPLDDGGAVAVLAGLGRPWRSGDPMVAMPGALVLLPLVGRDGLRGMARLESFLPQKSGLEDQDYGLLELVSEQGGLAIENVWARVHAPDVPMTRQSVSEQIQL
ncbi:MAG: hypothetical protein D6705_15305 [Deltaproteobacteria bacterium]|nr:MAG: hypothetical protein D6705_15305 [Deltaproteobacteria bacterium]